MENSQIEDIQVIQPGPPPVRKEFLPKATPVLVFGITSILCAFIYGVPGLVFAIVARAQVKKAKAFYEAEPDRYSEASVKLYKAGKTCSLIGLIFSIFVIVTILVIIVVVVGLHS